MTAFDWASSVTRMGDYLSQEKNATAISSPSAKISPTVNMSPKRGNDIVILTSDISIDLYT